MKKSALVAIILGSRADFTSMKRCFEVLRTLGVPYVFELLPTYRGQERLAGFVPACVEQGIEVFIVAGGRNAGIATSLSSMVTQPVIGVPLDSSPLRGKDSLYALVQAPDGCPVATVGINNAENAALLAVQILALKYPRLRGGLVSYRTSSLNKTDANYREMVNEYPEICDPSRTRSLDAAQLRTDDDTDPGSDEVTPDQHITPSGAVSIRPGAKLEPGPPVNRVFSAGSLIPTPRPQEPVLVNENVDPSLSLTPLALSTIMPPDDEALIGKKKRKSSSTERDPNIDAAPFPEPPRVDTKVFQVSHENPDEDVLTHAMMVLLEGGIVAFPTDTVYGLAVDATNADAVHQLYELKGQDVSQKSLSILIHHQDLLNDLVKEVPPAAESVIEHFWPGALTILFLKNPKVFVDMAETPSIAVRIPDDGVALRLMQLIDRPLAVINSAVGSQPEPASEAREVIDRFQGRIDCILDAGSCAKGKSSTVLSVLGEPFEVLREGAVTREQLAEVLGPRLKA